MSKISNAPKDDNGFIHITTTNASASAKNDEKLAAIQEKEFTFKAMTSGVVNMSQMIAEEILILKVGAQVMFLANDSGGRYVNGTLGKVVQVDEDQIKVQIANKTTIINVKTYYWNNEFYSYDAESKSIRVEIIGRLTQYPIKLAWSITVHKSQGLSFDKVIVV